MFKSVLLLEGNILNLEDNCMEENILDISIQINILESLSRILLEALREGDNLKNFDASNLAKVVLERTVSIKNSLNKIEQNLEI